MQSTFDERNWLAWLVKVRILILTFLLGIELAVAQFTPTPVPMRLFLCTICFWYSLSLFYVLLLSLWQEHGPFLPHSDEHRSRVNERLSKLRVESSERLTAAR